MMRKPDARLMGRRSSVRTETNSSAGYFDKVSSSVEWAQWFAFLNIALSGAIGIRYLIEYPRTAVSTLDHFYAIVSLIGHFGFLCFMFFLLFLFPFSFIITGKKAYRTTAFVTASILNIALLVDTQIFHYFHFHMSWQILRVISDFDRSSLGLNFYYLIYSVPAVIAIESVLIRYADYKCRKTRIPAFTKVLIAAAVVCFVATHLLHVWADAVKYRPITDQSYIFPMMYPMTARSFLAENSWITLPEAEQSSRRLMNYPLRSITAEKHPERNFILISLNGLRGDMLTRENMPNLNQAAAGGLSFTSHFSTSVSPYDSVFSMLYGLIPQYADLARDARIDPVLFDELQRDRSDIRIFRTGKPWDDDILTTASAGLRGFDSIVYSRTDDETVAAFMKYLAGRSGEKESRFFALLLLNGPLETVLPEKFHGPFGHGTRKNRTVSGMTGNLGEELRNSYRNAVYYTDSMLGPLFDTASGMPDTITIVTSDKGFDFDLVGKDVPHAGRFTYASLHVPLVIMGEGVENGLRSGMTNHADIAPTILSRFLGVTNSISDYSTGSDLTGMLTNSFVTGGDSGHTVIIDRKKISVFSRDGGYTVADGIEKNDTSKGKLSDDELKSLIRTENAMTRFISR
jgi:membrane-anchored protein YejM (alkaline phosphatase superfamily)